MEFKYKCPVCKANNILKDDNLYCRRCRSNLASIYNAKKDNFFKIIKLIINGN